MSVVAHEDDDLLFQNPDLQHEVRAGRCVRVVYLTAGDDNMTSSYWKGRENGVMAAYASMAGVANTWSTDDAGIAGHPAPLRTLIAKPGISLVFLRLPDGGMDGSGGSRYGYGSLQKLYQGRIPSLSTVDRTSSYTSSSLVTALTGLMTAFGPDAVLTLDYQGGYEDADHSDHHTAAWYARSAQAAYTRPHTFTGFKGYTINDLPENVTGQDRTDKTGTFLVYAPYDSNECQTEAACWGKPETLWWARQYSMGDLPPGTGTSAQAGPDQTVGVGQQVTLDGSASIAGAGATYLWKQVSGTAVTLSDPASVRPTFTAPAAAGTLVFSLTVTVGATTSAPDTVTVAVLPAQSDVTSSATASASSQNAATSQTADKAVDGVVDGYPGNYTKEWATTGGGAGSWLALTWPAPVTLSRVVLYDRPNDSDQITSGSLEFSDGTTVAVPALDNGGAATTVTFSPRTTSTLRLRITGVSSTTYNIGLAEIRTWGSR